MSEFRKSATVWSPALLRVVGWLNVLLAVLMLIPAIVSAIVGDGQSHAFILAAIITALVGGVPIVFTRDAEHRSIRRKESFLVVTLCWLLASLFGSLPYIIGGTLPHVPDAIFETVSGFTTTGASVIPDLEVVPFSVHLWRSITQWLGGMGIIVLTVAILPVLGIGGMELFTSEAPGPKTDKLTPRIKETAKRLWGIYMTLTLVCASLLFAGGMSVQDAICHALTTVSSGGFGTRNASIAAWDSNMIRWTITAFMFLAGTNVTLIYFLVQGKLKRLRRNEEFRFYVFLIAGVTVLLIALLSAMPDQTLAIRDVVFTVVSLVTTTGFVVVDYTTWMPISTMILTLLLVVGACAGSTSGGIKVVRHALMAKNTLLEPRRLMHPRGVIPVRFNSEGVATSTLYNIQAFIVLYFGIAAGSFLILSLCGLDGVTSLGAVLTSLGNVGPGLGEVGPASNFASLPPAVNLFLCFLMILGRLELFTVLIVLTPFFWSSYSR